MSVCVCLYIAGLPTPPGYYAPNTGWSYPLACQANSYSTTYGATSCASCSVLQYGSTTQYFTTTRTTTGVTSCTLLNKPVSMNVFMPVSASNVGYLATDSYMVALDLSSVNGSAITKRSDAIANSNLVLGSPVTFGMSDPASDTAYLVTASNSIVAVTLSTLTNQNRTLRTFGAGMNATAAALDATNGFIYLAVWNGFSSAASLVQVTVGNTPSSIINITGDSRSLNTSGVSVNTIIAAVVDSANGYAYCISSGANSPGAHVVRVSLSAAASGLSSAALSILTLSTATGAPTTATLASGKLYIATASSQVIQVDLATFTVAGTLLLVDETSSADCTAVTSAVGPASAPFLAIVCTQMTSGQGNRLILVNTTTLTRTAGQKIDSGYVSFFAMMGAVATINGSATPVMQVVAKGSGYNPAAYPYELARVQATVCPAGSVMSPSGACTPCAAAMGSKAGDVTCQACPRGYYNGVVGGTCISCGAGYYGVYAGQTTFANACNRCPPGTAAATVAQSPSGTGITCPLCPAGTYQPGNTSATCLSCAAGTYSTTTGRTTTCDACPTGTYSVPGSTACLVSDGFIATMDAWNDLGPVVKVTTVLRFVPVWPRVLLLAIA